MDFSNKPILAMIHLSGGNPVERALEEIQILEEEGVDGIIVENYHGDEMDVVNTLKAMNETDMLVGINLLPNEFHMSIPMADTYGADFVQLDYVSGNYERVEPFDIESYEAVRKNFPNVKVLGGVWPKYYEPIIEYQSPNHQLFYDLAQGRERADATVVTGSGTGKETPLEKVELFRRMCGSHPLIVGAGLNPSNVVEQLTIADGAIVGSCLKPYKLTREKISRDLVKEFMDEVAKVR